MSERIKFQGHLADAELRERELRIKLEGLVSSLRDLLDPIADVGVLKGEIIAQQALEFGQARINLLAVRSEIERIKGILGV